MKHAMLNPITGKKYPISNNVVALHVRKANKLKQELWAKYKLIGEPKKKNIFSFFGFGEKYSYKDVFELAMTEINKLDFFKEEKELSLEDFFILQVYITAFHLTQNNSVYDDTRLNKILLMKMLVSNNDSVQEESFNSLGLDSVKLERLAEKEPIYSRSNIFCIRETQEHKTDYYALCVNKIFSRIFNPRLKKAIEKNIGSIFEESFQCLEDKNSINKNYVS
jgi:hypothetical protein